MPLEPDFDQLDCISASSCIVCRAVFRGERGAIGCSRLALGRSGELLKCQIFWSAIFMLLERRIVLSRFLKLSTPVLLTAPVAKCGESETRTWWHSTTHGQRTYRGWLSCGTMQNPCLLDVGPSFLDILGRRMAHVVKFQLLLVSFLSPSFFSAYPNPLRLESPTATHKPTETLTCFFIQL